MSDTEPTLNQTEYYKHLTTAEFRCRWNEKAPLVARMSREEKVAWVERHEKEAERNKLDAAIGRSQIADEDALLTEEERRELRRKEKDRVKSVKAATKKEVKIDFDKAADKYIEVMKMMGRSVTKEAALEAVGYKPPEKKEPAAPLSNAEKAIKKMTSVMSRAQAIVLLKASAFPECPDV
jgi:hypothetical protein